LLNFFLEQMLRVSVQLFANRSQPMTTTLRRFAADANFSQRDQLFGRVSYSRRHANIPGDFTGLGDDTDWRAIHGSLA